jgi:hypothetical protein
MQLRHRVGTAVVIAAAVVAGTALAKGTPESRDEVRTEQKERGNLPFFDLSHVVDGKKLGDSRWEQKDPPPYQNVSEDKGAQLYMTLPLGAAADGGWAVEVVVFKMIHSEPTGGNMRSVFSMTFDNIGKTCQVSAWKDVLENTYLDWKKAASDVNDKDCTDPRKSSLGPAKMWASATGTDPETKKRERRDWYVWNAPNVTWLARVRFDQSMLSNDAMLKKGEDLVKAVTQLKDKRL